MAGNTRESEQSETGITSASLIGGGIGSAIIVFAKQMPETNELKHWLLVAAPPIAVIISNLWRAVRRFILNWGRRTSSKRFYEDSCKTIEEALQGNHTSEEHKAILKAQLEEIQLIYVQSVRGDLAKSMPEE